VAATVVLGISTVLIAREQWKTQAALKLLAQEEARTKAAFEAEAAQRVRAEAIFRQAREAVDFFAELSEDELADKPELQGLRRKLLEAALAYYQNFIEQSRDDPTLQAQLAASHLRVANILEQIGTRSEALAALERARQLGEKLVRDHPNVPEFQRGLSSIYDGFGLVLGGRDLHLLSQKAVQADLKLTDDQVRKAGQLAEKRHEVFRRGRNLSPEEWRGKFEELASQEKALTDLLEPQQSRRLHQIALQLRGADAFGDPVVVAALHLTSEQKNQIQKAQDEAHHPSGGHRFDPRPEGVKKGEEHPRSVRERIVSVLTEEQKERWKELIGEPFKGEIRPPRREGPGPPPQGPPWGGPSRRP
jgi:hypothetical protein